MISIIKELFTLLSPSQRRQFVVLQILVIIMAITEIISIASITPFMALIGDISLLEQDNFLAELYRFSGLTKPYDFVFWVGILVLLILATSSIFSMLTLWRLLLFGNKLGMQLSDRLFHFYMHKPWLFHASGNSSVLLNEINGDSSRVNGLIIQPLMTMNAKIILAVFISVGLLIFNPLVAATGVVIFSFAYLFLYKLVKKTLSANGAIISKMNADRFLLMSEGFGGIKDTLLLGCQRNFTDRFHVKGKSLGQSQATNQTLIKVPQYFMELISFSTLIFLVLYLIQTNDGNLGKILPLLSVYALACFKLLPALQNIYNNLANMRSGIPSYMAIRSALQDSIKRGGDNSTGQEKEYLHAFKSIALKNVTFTYPNKDKLTIDNISIELPVNKVIGLVGSTGSGKSTTIDLILGLIQPDSGNLCIDGEPLALEQKRAWQNTLGFVPQSIFLCDSTIKGNIAFGQTENEIDFEKVKRVAKLAHLDDMIAQLPEGYDTRVGERGVQLSGGQRQRIGIARALYNDADVLVLDEATSALDGITEKIIMDAIHDFAGNKTIIMIAHRFTTVKKCDIIFFMSEGSVIDQGTYSELFKRNEVFRKMASET